jgi:hypothetical protein
MGHLTKHSGGASPVWEFAIIPSRRIRHGRTAMSNA